MEAGTEKAYMLDISFQNKFLTPTVCYRTLFLFIEEDAL